MIDMMKKAMFAGMGIISLTKEKVEELAQDFIEKGKLTEQEGKKFVDEILEHSDESKEAIRQQIDERIQFALEKMHIAKSSEVEELKAQVMKLQEAMKKHQGKKESE